LILQTHYGNITLQKRTGDLKMTGIMQEQAAAIMWERLVAAFNEEAKTYDPEAYDSELGSIGEVEDREVCRSAWWDALGGDELIGAEYYSAVTWLIESEHRGEQLETGWISFGS
jgi:hypothetical protein